MNNLNGKSRTRAYTSYRNMLARCTNPKAVHFDRYGGRGITICDRWLHSFLNFLEDMGERPIGMTIERIDNDGNYEPGNCRWATRKEQSRNTSFNHRITYNGESKTIAAWSEELNIPQMSIWYRAKVGLPIEQIMMQGSIRASNIRTIEVDGQQMTVKELARKLGMTPEAVNLRIRRGVPVDQPKHQGIKSA